MRGMTLEWVIETNIHADHLSEAPYIQQKLSGETGVGARITEIQKIFGKIFNEARNFSGTGRSLTPCSKTALHTPSVG
jgi:hypothetical protein